MSQPDFFEELRRERSAIAEVYAGLVAGQAARAKGFRAAARASKPVHEMAATLAKEVFGPAADHATFWASRDPERLRAFRSLLVLEVSS
jgi:hypothetical protein